MKRFAASIPPTIAANSVTTLLLRHLYPQSLKASIFLSDPLITDATYALFIKSGSILDPYLSASLITHFSLSGDFSRATQFLRDTHCPDTVVYNSLISGYARSGQSEPLFELFNELKWIGLKPDVCTLSSLIKGACNNLNQNEIIHGVSVKIGFISSAFLISGLIENYSKLGLPGSAEKCFEECLILDSVVWTAMINGYIRNERFHMAREILKEMSCLGMELNEFSFTSVLGAVFDVKHGEQIHGFGAKMGLLSGCSIHLNNALMNMYCKCGCKFDALKVFDEIPDPDIVSWSGRIAASYDGKQAFETFKFCFSSGFQINEYTLINVLSKFDSPEFLKPGIQTHGICYKIGYLCLVSICNAMISMYGKNGQMNDAKGMFGEMFFRDSVSWNSLIAAFSENGYACEAMSTFSEMRFLSLQPNEYTMATVLEVASNSKDKVMQIHPLILKLGLISDDSMISCLITVYGKCNSIDESKRVFGEIEKSNISCFNSMMAAFSHEGCHDNILELFKNRQSLSLEVDSISFSIVLKACGLGTDLEQARSIHCMGIKLGINMDNYFESALIDVYCKCGAIDDGEKVFESLSNENLAAWNAMIMGYAQNGRNQEVFDLFNKMRELGIDPDEITFIGVLSSCSHLGFVKEARNHLNSMSKVYGLFPCLEHYACLVDVLSRVGRLDEAKMVIEQMPVLADAKIWMILLSGCNDFGNIFLGTFAFRKVLEIEPENDSAFVLLSNLYASVGMWGLVGELRREMKERDIFKGPGASWIQIGGSIRYFFAGESESESESVFVCLKSLKKQMVEFDDEEDEMVLLQ